MPWKGCTSPMSSSQNSSSSSEAREPKLKVVERPQAAPAPVAPITPLNDVVCTIDVVLGSSQLSVRECLRLQPDSIIELAQSAGGDMLVSINGVTVAHGEVMIVEDSTAIRITDILPPPSSEIVE